MSLFGKTLEVEQPDEIFEDVIRNLVQEVMRECMKQKIRISEEFIKFYVHILILDPSWKVLSTKRIDRTHIQNFIKYCVSKVANAQTVPSMVTLKMQLYFTTNFNSQDEMIAKNRANLHARLMPLEKEILETQYKQFEDSNLGNIYMHKLYKKIIVYIILLSGLGNPTMYTVYSEAKLALASIFTKDELKEFSLLSYKEKEEQLVELKNLVMGIRLFNRDRNRGGTGIEDLPAMLSSSFKIFNINLQTMLRKVMITVNMLTTALENCYAFVAKKNGEIKMILKIPKEVQESDVEYAKDYLYLHRQMEIYIRKLMDEVAKMEKRFSNSLTLLQETFITLHGVVSFRCAIPTNRVFPLFLEIANFWIRMQDFAILLSRLNQMLYQLNEFIKPLHAPTELYKIMIGPEGPRNDAERLQETSGLKITDINSNIKVLHAEYIGTSDIQIQFLGFCPWTLVNTDGALIPGNPNMGICKLENEFYVFSCLEGAQVFGANPETLKNAVLELARKKPALINLLQLYDILNSVRDIDRLYIPPKEVIETDHVETQTELHPIPHHIDPNYRWNLWEWKRQALMLATISRMKTKSTQTYLSNAIEEIHVQTWLPKDQMSQTKRDNYTNVPTLSNFIYGLRGRIDDQQHIITLTRPIDEFLTCKSEKKCIEKEKADNM